MAVWTGWRGHLSAASKVPDPRWLVRCRGPGDFQCRRHFRWAVQDLGLVLTFSSAFRAAKPCAILIHSHRVRDGREDGSFGCMLIRACNPMFGPYASLGFMKGLKERTTPTTTPTMSPNKLKTRTTHCPIYVMGLGGCASSSRRVSEVAVQYRATESNTFLPHNAHALFLSSSTRCLPRHLTLGTRIDCVP